MVMLSAFIAAVAPAHAHDEASGITAPRTLPAFDPAAPPCHKPPGLAPVLAFVQDNRREFMQGVSRGLAAAAAVRGLRYEVALADNDADRMSRQVDVLRQNRVGALVVAPVNADALAPHLRAVIDTGAYVGAVVPPPATSILNAPQYMVGRTLAEAAAHYITVQLDGRADVVLLTHDSLQFLSPRFAAMRDVLEAMPGIVIVADISPPTVDKAGGRATMETILLANPNVDVVLGADTVVLGALEALRQTGRERPDQFLGGIDGEPEAIAEIKRGGPYKATIGLNSPVFAYAMGMHAADWLAGGSVPQAMDILPTVLNRETIPAYEADLADPRSVFDDPARRARYLTLYGNICYDTRDQYLNFPWSSETR